MFFFCEVLVDPQHNKLSFFLMVQFNLKKKIIIECQINCPPNSI